jgi:hypothetical protein
VIEAYETMRNRVSRMGNFMRFQAQQMMYQGQMWTPGK